MRCADVVVAADAACVRDAPTVAGATELRGELLLRVARHYGLRVNRFAHFAALRAGTRVAAAA
jgi:hypothetical protein